MHTVKLRSHIDADGHLRLDLPTDLPSGDVELVVVIETPAAPQQRKYDFRDLSGTLRWQGDATTTQRAVRDEW